MWLIWIMILGFAHSQELAPDSPQTESVPPIERKPTSALVAPSPPLPAVDTRVIGWTVRFMVPAR